LPDYLILSNNLLWVGALRFSNDAATQREPDAKTPHWELSEVYAAVNALVQGEPLSDLQAEMLAQGSSMDGMRQAEYTISVLYLVRLKKSTVKFVY